METSVLPTKTEIKSLWGDDLYKAFHRHINEDGWLTSEWAQIIEDEIPKWDDDYNTNPDFEGTYSRMYNTDFEESEDGTMIRPVAFN